jgi:hypothetical protein
MLQSLLVYLRQKGGIEWFEHRKRRGMIDSKKDLPGASRNNWLANLSISRKAPEGKNSDKNREQTGDETHQTDGLQHRMELIPVQALNTAAVQTTILFRLG